MASQPRLVVVRQNILKHNDVLARELRERFRRAGVTVVSLVSSPGSGKTAFLERTLTELRSQYRVAAIVGDLATDHDAARLARSQATVRQITTDTVCHLDAQMVLDALADWKVDEFDFLFIENVGNLVCPSAYDLGEGLRVILLSVTEGEDKPLKYPTIFNTADLAVITKIDLALAVEFDMTAANDSIQAVRPGMPIIHVSAKTGEGMDRWLQELRTLRKQTPLGAPAL
jgi:hydrogenase nickel incorporation protein HypB